MFIVNAIIPFCEVVIIAILINYLLSFFWKTKSFGLIIGLLIFLAIFAVSNWFDLPVLHRITLLFGQAAIVAFIIIFQPELRLALSKITLRGKRFKEISEFDKFLDHLANSTYKLAEKRIGALIVLENEDSLEEYAQKGVNLNADFSSELLETIFVTTTPLHDGAVIIREKIILAAGSILPLAEDSSQITQSMGTRHRAALGLSLISDALIIIISEESAKVSIARDGIMTRGIKIDRFKGIIRSIFTPPEDMNLKKQYKWF